MRTRIISGKFKGRFITIPQSEHIRPTTNRVKETLFNLINNRISFEGLNVLDLYAGSGSLGIECLSRGAKQITFVEKDFFIYKNLLQNIKTLDSENECTIIKTDAVSYTNKTPVNKFDLVLADPPFFKYEIYTVVENILAKGYLAEGGFMFIERSIQTKEKDSEYLKTEPFKIIGDACLYELKV